MPRNNHTQTTVSQTRACSSQWPYLRDYVSKGQHNAHKWLKQRTEIVGVTKICAHLFPPTLALRVSFFLTILSFSSTNPLLPFWFQHSLLLLHLDLMRNEKHPLESKNAQTKTKGIRKVAKDVFSILRRCLTIITSLEPSWSFVGHQAMRMKNKDSFQSDWRWLHLLWLSGIPCVLGVAILCFGGVFFQPS